MVERVISIKMPTSLVAELRKLTAEQHYLDLSEQLRSIVRQKSLKYARPYDEELKQLRAQIASDAANATMTKEQLLRELGKLLREDGS